MNQAYSYIRWSTDIQKLGDSERRQLAKSREYAKEHNLDLIEEMSDSGISAFRGKNAAEGKLSSFLGAIRDKKIKKGSYLLVENFDRLSRQNPLTAFGIFSDIIQAGIAIVTLHDEKVYGNGNESDLGSLITGLVSMSRSHEESVVKSTRIAAAWSNKRTNGKTEPLTARCPLWLDLPRVDPNKKHAPRRFSVNRARAAVVKKIFQDSASGIGIHIIMNQLNASKTPTFSSKGGWAKSSIGKILHHRGVLGEFQPCRRIGNKRIPEGEPIPNYYPAIISPDLFYKAEQSRAQRLLHGKPIGGRNSGFNNLFGGIMRCAYCNSSMHYQDKGKGHKYLVCYSASAGKGCSVKTGWDYPQFEKSFVEFVRDIDLNSIGSSDVESLKILDLENEVVGLKGTLATIKEQQDITHAAMTKEKLDFFVRKIKELEQQSIDISGKIKSKESALDALVKSSRNLSQSREQIKPLLQRLQDFKVRAEASSKIKALVETIYVATMGWRNDFLSFLKGNNRKFVAGWLKQARNRFFIVHFKNTNKLLFVSWHPDNEQWHKGFSFSPSPTL